MFQACCLHSCPFAAVYMVDVTVQLLSGGALLGKGSRSFGIFCAALWGFFGIAAKCSGVRASSA